MPARVGARQAFGAVSVVGGGVNKASVPDSAALSVIGDIDVRAAVRMVDWTPGTTQTFVAKNVDYVLRMGPSNLLQFVWHNGTGNIVKAATAALPVADNGVMLVRATLDVDNGSAQNVVTFYRRGATGISPLADLLADDGWTQVGATVVTAGATVIRDTTAVLEIGSRNSGASDLLVGSVYAAVVKNGINGTIVASLDFTTSPEFDQERQYVVGEVASLAGRRWKATTTVPPGCPPLGVGDGSAFDRAVLVARAMGHGRAVTGGLGFPMIRITNNADSGAGSYRQAVADGRVAGGAWFVFDGDYAITLSHPAPVIDYKNVTIDGRGHTVTINGSGAVGERVFLMGGFTGGPFNPAGPDTIVGKAGNIIICNVTMDTGFDDDNQADVIAALWKTNGIWLDHCSITNDAPNQGDELINMGYGSSDITMSWCHIHDHYKAILWGSGQAALFWDQGGGGDEMRVTVSHCFFDTIPDRACRLGGGGKLHFLNNWMKDWGTGGGVFSLNEGQFLSEGNIYDPIPGAIGNQLVGLRTTEGVIVSGYARSVGDDLREGATLEVRNPELVADPVYAYSADLADATLESRISAYAKANPTVWSLLPANTDGQGNVWTVLTW